MDDYPKHEIDLIRKYEEMGYDHSYHFKDERLFDSDTGNSYSSEKVFIVAEHRYEGMSNPSDLSILYVLETNDGGQGTLLMAYGPSANMDLAEFIKNIPETNISDRAIVNINRK